MDSAQVVITVPRAKKGAWVAASRAQGQPLTADQFVALAALMRLSIDTPRGRALRAVLCYGVTPAAAARYEGISHQPVYRAVSIAKNTMALACVISARQPASV